MSQCVINRGRGSETMRFVINVEETEADPNQNVREGGGDVTSEAPLGSLKHTFKLVLTLCFTCFFKLVNRHSCLAFSFYVTLTK